MCVMSRAEYDELRTRENVEGAQAVGMRMSEQEARYMADADYPKTTEQVIAELNRRGLAATDWRLQRLTRFPDLRPREIGGTFMWTKEAVDRVAEQMLDLGMLTVSARYRKELGVTWAQERDMRRRAIAEKEAVNA